MTRDEPLVLRYAREALTLYRHNRERLTVPEEMEFMAVVKRAISLALRAERRGPRPPRPKKGKMKQLPLFGGEQEKTR